MTHYDRTPMAFPAVAVSPIAGDASLGQFLIQPLDLGITTLATDGAATTVDANLPAGGLFLGAAAEITTAPAGLGAGAALTMALTGGSSTSVGAFSALTANTKLTKLVTPEVLSATTDITLTFSGGAGSDNTPTAGAVRVIAYYATLADI